MKSLLKSCLLVIGMVCCCLTVRTLHAQDMVAPIELNQIKMSGWLGDKITQCIQNGIIQRNVDRLINPFRLRTETSCWQSEFWGKWMLSAVDAFRYSRDARLKAKLDSAVAGLLQTQTKDGYIGNYALQAHLQQWDVWGRKYCMLGLLAYYDLTQDRQVLKAAEQLADHLLTEIGPGKADIIRTGNFRGMPSSSILEPIVFLYNRTKEKRYLDFAEYIVSQWETEAGPWLISKALAEVAVAERFPHPDKFWSWENGLKAYEMMSCYDGLLELYKTTGKPEYLKTVKMTVNNILATEMLITGSGSSFECWYHGRSHQTEPAMHMQETCVTQTILKLLYKLYQVTADPALVDQMEIITYNALLGAMTPDGGSFAKYSPLIGFRQLGEEQCNMGMNCCTANGPRGLLLIPQMAIMKDKTGPVINLYGESSATLSLPSGQKLDIKLETDYPQSGVVRIILSLKKEEKFSIKLRVPAWSQTTQIRINLADQENPATGKYVTIERLWKNNDQVSMSLDLNSRWVTEPVDHHRHVAIMRGPIVMARDTRLDAIDVDEPAKPYSQSKEKFTLQGVQASAPFWITCKALFQLGDCYEFDLGKPRELVLCDYASAGNSWSRDSRYRVWWPLAVNPTLK